MSFVPFFKHERFSSADRRYLKVPLLCSITELI